MNRILSWVSPLLGLIVGIGVFGPGYAQVAVNEFACGPIAPKGQVGPFDYRTATPDLKERIEAHHFTAKVENLQGGENSYLGGDIDYTLRAFPNSPRALMSLVRYDLKTHSERIGGAIYAIECYFERAIRFKPDDPMPHLIYAIYLKDRKRPSEATVQLDEADRLRGDPTNFDFDYNLGLIYFDTGQYDKASVAAQRAYALGAPLPALRDKLKAKGKWAE